MDNNGKQDIALHTNQHFGDRNMTACVVSRRAKYNCPLRLNELLN